MVRSEALKKAQAKYQKEYQKKNEIIKTIKLNRNTDKEIIDHIQTINNFSGYIKELIKKDIETKK